MRYLALVTDYDGTIATKGRVSAIALQTMAPSSIRPPRHTSYRSTVGRTVNGSSPNRTL
jgi:hypothetical protein